MIRKAGVLALLLTVLAVGSYARGEIAQKGSLRVSFSGMITPHTLPRYGKAPIKVSLGTKIASAKGKNPPQLRRLEIAINKNGVLDDKGIPICPLDEIQPSTTSGALRSCGDSLVGEGLFEAKVLLKGQTDFPSRGKLYAFSSRIHGRPAILAHVYGTRPAPTSFTMIFETHKTKGTFGTVLSAAMPEVSDDSGYVTGLSLRLGKSFRLHGRPHSYISAGCPAPKGVGLASFDLARATFTFAGRKLSSVISRSCRARG
jgi:hypothetical protein